MKRNYLLIFAVVATLFGTIAPNVAGAVDSLYVAQTVLTDTNETGIPTVYFMTPASFVSGKTVYCVLDAWKYCRPILSSNGALVTTFVLMTSLSAAADSMNFSLHVGPTRSGPWTSVYAMAPSFAATGTAPYVLKAAVAASTLPPMPYWKVTAKAKKTFTEAQRISISWPFPKAE